MPMTIKFVSVVTYNEELPSIKPLNPLTMGSCKIT